MVVLFVIYITLLEQLEASGSFSYRERFIYSIKINLLLKMIYTLASANLLLRRSFKKRTKPCLTSQNWSKWQPYRLRYYRLILTRRLKRRTNPRKTQVRAFLVYLAWSHLRRR